MRAFSYLNGVKNIIVEQLKMEDGVDVVGAVAAFWVCLDFAPAGKYYFKNKHKIISQAIFNWEVDYNAIERHLRDCGIKPVECDIMDGLEMARDYAFSAKSISQLCGFTVAVQAALDASGISVPFSPYNIDPIVKKDRKNTKRNAAQRSRRLAAGVKPHSQSDARLKPWEALGISRATYYRLKKDGTLPSCGRPCRETKMKPCIYQLEASN